MPIDNSENHAADIADYNRDLVADLSDDTRDTMDAAVEVQSDMESRTFEATSQAADETAQAVGAELHAAAETVQRTNDRVSRLFATVDDEGNDWAAQSSQNIQAMADCQGVLARGLHDISREWMQLAQGVVRKQMESATELSQCRSLPGLIAMQSDLLRDNLERMVLTSRRVSELSLGVTDEATRRLKPAA